MAGVITGTRSEWRLLSTKSGYDECSSQVQWTFTFFSSLSLSLSLSFSTAYNEYFLPLFSLLLPFVERLVCHKALSLSLWPSLSSLLVCVLVRFSSRQEGQAKVAFVSACS